MKYRKIKISSKDAPKRFYRLLYVREDLNLFQLGVTILMAFDYRFMHNFLFTDKKNEYVDKMWIEEYPIESPFDNGNSNYKDYENCILSDLILTAENKFKMCYDTGDNWEFEIKLYKAEKEFDDDSFGKLIEGAGGSIWEDNHYLFWKYLENGSEAISDEDKDFLLERLNIRVDDFDKPINVGSINDELESAEELCEHLLEMRDMYL